MTAYDPDSAAQIGSSPASRTAGWLLVLGSAMALAVGNGPAVLYSFSVFVKPLGNDLQVGRGELSLAPSIAVALYGIATLLSGRLFDRLGLRPVVLTSIAATAALFACLGLFVQGVASLIVLYVAVTVAATGFSAVPFAKVLVAAFERRRGLALGLAMAGIGAGTALVPLYCQAVVLAYGWRAGYVALGALVFLLAFPAAYVTLPNHAEAAAASPAPLEGLSAREALSRPVFWLIAAIFFALAVSTTGVFAHITALLTDRGLSPMVAATAISFGGIALVLGRIVTGLLLDRLHARYVTAGFFATAAAGAALLVVAGPPALSWLGVTLIGIALGAEVDLIAYLTSRYFGLRAFGAVYSYLLAIFIAGGALGPLAMGVSYSATGSYRTALVAFLVATIAGTGLATRLGAYPYAIAKVPEQ